MVINNNLKLQLSFLSDCIHKCQFLEGYTAAVIITVANTFIIANRFCVIMYLDFNILMHNSTLL